MKLHRSSEQHPDNITLMDEARITKDCERQLELASHPSALVHRALLQNPSLCEQARKFLEGKIGTLVDEASAQLNKALKN